MSPRAGFHNEGVTLPEVSSNLDGFGAPSGTMPEASLRQSCEIEVNSPDFAQEEITSCLGSVREGGVGVDTGPGG